LVFLLSFSHLTSVPKLEAAVDLAAMKLDKARLDAEEQHTQEEEALRLTEEYCNGLIYPGGTPSDVTNLVEGRDNIAGDKEQRWADMNATMLVLQNRRRLEAERKLQLAAFEVEAKKKMVYLARACPTDVAQLEARTATMLPSPVSKRCLECGGTNTAGDARIAKAARTDKSSEEGRRYCAWETHKCWEVDFIAGRCQPPPGYPAKCYRAHLLDPHVAQAVENYLSTKKQQDALAQKDKQQGQSGQKKASLLEMRARAKAAVAAAADAKGDDGQAYWLPPASGDASAGGAAPASPGTSQYSVSPQAFYGGAAGGGGGGGASPGR
jgi:hypothetical protein